MSLKSRSSFTLLFIVLLGACDTWAKSHTTCKDPSVTWWNNADGLNPCQQYEALRRLCDANYEVPIMNAELPGDTCDTQLYDCCCNSISFALSMMCLNCQLGVGSGRKGDTGIDAPDNTYASYRGHCGPTTNQSLPTRTQMAVCRTKLHLGAFLYNLFWAPGSWFLEYTRQTSTLDVASGMNNPNRCNYTKTTSTTMTTLSSSSSSSGSIMSPTSASTTTAHPLPESKSKSSKDDTASSESDSNHMDYTAVILGSTLGGSLVLVLLLAWLFYSLRKRHTEEFSIHPFQAAYASQRVHTSEAGARVSVVRFNEGATSLQVAPSSVPESSQPKVQHLQPYIPLDTPPSQYRQ